MKTPPPPEEASEYVYVPGSYRRKTAKWKEYWKRRTLTYTCVFCSPQTVLTGAISWRKHLRDEHDLHFTTAEKLIREWQVNSHGQNNGKPVQVKKQRSWNWLLKIVSGPKGLTEYRFNPRDRGETNCLPYRRRVREALVWNTDASKYKWSVLSSGDGRDVIVRRKAK
jgi:hypothetical protein